MRNEARLAVEVPEAGKDSPSWVKVGVIAAIGFVVGVAWPRLAGVRLGPSAPGEASSPANASPRASAARPPEAPPASVPALRTPAPAVAPSSTGASLASPPQIHLGRGSVVS